MGTAVRSRFWGDLAVISIPAFLKLILHFVSNGRYGYFRDEFYYLACADHLSWGFVDHPPLSIAVLALFRALLGDSIFAIRLPAVLASCASVVLAGLIVRELGGKRFSQLLTATAVAVAPIFLSIASFYSMNACDHLFWAILLLILVRIVRTNRPKLWLWFGLVAGLGMQNKISVAFLGFGVVVGLLLTRHRSHFKSPWIWVGGALAFLLFLPHLVWQASYGWPTLEFMHNARVYKMAPMPPQAFLGAQVLYVHPLNVALSVLGLLYVFFVRSMAPYRILGWIFLAVLILLIVQQAKPYYAGPAFLAVLPLGAIALERGIDRIGGPRAATAQYGSAPASTAQLLKIALLILLVLAGAITAPLSIPLLSPEAYVAYAQRLGVAPPQEEKSAVEGMPQHLADRFGWEDMVVAVADVYHRLSDEDRAQCAIVGSDYGDAGAIDFFGDRYGLPGTVSAHNNYYLWGPGDASGEIAIVVDLPREKLDALYESVEEAAHVSCPYCMPGMRDRAIYLCRKLKVPLEDVWRQAKEFI